MGTSGVDSSNEIEGGCKIFLLLVFIINNTDRVQLHIESKIRRKKKILNAKTITSFCRGKQWDQNIVDAWIFFFFYCVYE